MGMEAGGALVQLSRLRQEIEAARDLDELRDLRDKSTGAATYLKAIGERIEIVNAAVDGKLRCERRMGQFLAERDKAHGARGKGKKVEFHDGTPLLSDLGIDKKQSHRWQKLAAIPEDKYETFVSECNEQGKELTTAGVMRWHSSVDRPAAFKSKKSKPAAEQTVSALLSSLGSAIRAEFSKWPASHVAVFADRLRSMADELDANGGFAE